MKIVGNTILITGGATGIGLALAEDLVRRGNVVIVCGRREERLTEAKRQIPGLVTFACDVADAESRRDLVEFITTEFQRTNVLVNNAGVQRLVDFTKAERDLANADEEIAINLAAPIHLSAELFPHLAKQPAAAIVNVSSGLAFAPLAHMPVYCATKAALHSLTLSMRYQLRNTSIRVFEMILPVVTSELGSAHRPASLNATAMPAGTAATEIVEALLRDQFEYAIGDAAGLVAKREGMFPIMNR